MKVSRNQAFSGAGDATTLADTLDPTNPILDSGQLDRHARPSPTRRTA